MKPINFEIWHLVVKKTSLLKIVGILITDQFDIQIIDCGKSLNGLVFRLKVHYLNNQTNQVTYVL